MITHHQAFTAISVDELDVAYTFYGETLGLDVTEDNGMLALHLAGGSTVLVYVRGQDHRPVSYSVLSFTVPDIDVAVKELDGLGVPVLRYPDVDQDARGVHRGDGLSIAWFADPAGNLLSVVEL